MYIVGFVYFLEALEELQEPLKLINSPLLGTWHFAVIYPRWEYRPVLGELSKLCAALRGFVKWCYLPHTSHYPLFLVESGIEIFNTSPS